MKTDYFKHCKTYEELKKLYFKLAMQHHPDRGGNAEVMKAINAEYDVVWPLLKDKHINKDNEAYTKETKETARQYPDIINAIIHFINVKIEICGSWVWVSGGTYPYRNEFKKLGFDWSKNKEAWYWKPESEEGFRRHKPFDMNQIRERYGSESIESEPLKGIA